MNQVHPDILQMQRDVAMERAELYKLRADVENQLSSEGHTYAVPPQVPRPPPPPTYQENQFWTQPPRYQEPPMPSYPQYQGTPSMPIPPPPPSKSPQETVNELPPEKLGYIPMKVAAIEAHRHIKGKINITIAAIAAPFIIMMLSVFSIYAATGAILLLDVALGVFLFKDMKEKKRLEAKYQLDAGASIMKGFK